MLILKKIEQVLTLQFIETSKSPFLKFKFNLIQQLARTNYLN